MQPEPQHHDVSRDPILDGRDSLRLVKLRLALTLIAVAILPIAAVSPVVRAVSEESRASQHQLLADQARDAAGDVRRELRHIRETLAELLDDPGLLAALAPGAGPAAREAASLRLEAVLGQPNGVVVASSLYDSGGVAAISGTPVELPALPASVLVAGVAPLPAGPEGARILVIESTASGVKPAHSIAATVAVPRLLGAASSDVDVPGRVLRIADPSGALIAEVDGPFDPAALPGEMLDLATMGSHESDGRSTLDVAGLPGWAVVVSAPIPLVAMPAQALSALGAMLVLVVVFMLWMARQILRPAMQLEASRSRLRELYEDARELAIRDSLTGLGNHRAFQEGVARMVEGARRYGTGFSLVLLDIDEFKRINDTRGHAVGDQLLAEVGAIINATIRHTDAAFRVGGDEFAILLPHTDPGGAIVLTRRLLARGLEDRAGSGYPGPISFSAGVTACPEFGTTRLELTAQADAALYRGKRTGRTVVTIFDPEKDHSHVDEGMRAELSSAITAVIESGSLTPVYQPVVELATGRVVGYEGLVRVPRESTFAHTGALFSAAEAAGRVQELDRAALDVVLRGAHALDPGVSLSVNLSPMTLEAAEFSAQTFLSILRRNATGPGRIVLELTEREAIRDPERLRTAMRGLQAAGVRIAADDVGAGNAGLRLLSQFRFDVVKIDLSLVQRGGDDQGQSVLRSIVEVAERMGATTTAEGIETSGQLRMARRLGITSGQGYLLGRPGSDLDLTWIDLNALELREDVAVPIGATVATGQPGAARWNDGPNGDAAAVLAGRGAGASGGGALASVRRRSRTFLLGSRRSD